MHNNSTHLLQVWDKAGNLAYQKMLTAKDNGPIQHSRKKENDFPESSPLIQAWIVIGNFFVYVLDEDFGKDSDFIYVVDMEAF